MTKNEYLAELKSRLISLPAEERDAALKYYQEFFEDAGAEHEQDVIVELGTPEALAQSIIAEATRTETSSTEYIPATSEDVRENRRERDWQNQTDDSQSKKNRMLLIIIVLIVLSPVILPVAASAFAVLVAVAAVVLALWVVCGILALGLSLGGIAAVGAGIVGLFSAPLEGLVAIAVGLVLVGIGLLALIPFVFTCSKLIPSAIRGIVELISRIFKRNQVKTL